MSMKQLGILGCGFMGQAILRSALQAGACHPGHIVVLERDPARAEQIRRDFAVATVTDIASLHACERLMLAIKPQNLAEIDPFPKAPRTVMSILAGTHTDTLLKTFPGGHIARVMPNLPIRHGAGMSAVFYAEKSVFPTQEQAFVQKLFESGGKVVELEREDQMNAFTAFCGSGPAYFLYLAEVLTTLADKWGFTPEQSDAMMRQTLIGAAALAQHDPDTPLAQLREQITSKGGTTQAALQAIQQVGDAPFQEMIAAAVARGKELEEGV